MANLDLIIDRINTNTINRDTDKPTNKGKQKHDVVKRIEPINNNINYAPNKKINKKTYSCNIHCVHLHDHDCVDYLTLNSENVQLELRKYA